MNEASPETGAMQDIFLGRQPILDRRQQLFAYELLFRSSTGGNAASFSDSVVATSTVIAHAFSELGMGEALGPYRGFINFDEHMLFSDSIELLPRQSCVIELLETIPLTPDVLARCRELKHEGFLLALDDVVELQAEHEPFLDLISFLKIELPAHDETSLHHLVSTLGGRHFKLLAEKVDTHEQFECCLRLGFDYFQGYHFARPTILAGKRSGHAEMTLIRLLGLILHDADVTVLESIFKTEPSLSVNLLRLTNSVSMGLPVHVTSLRHAMILLGQRQLQRWLQLLLFASGSGSADGVHNPLLQLAASRGRLMELLAARTHPHDNGMADQAFMCGMMSLMPALLGMPMSEILPPLPLPHPLKSALLGEANELRAMLDLTEACEAATPDAQPHALARKLGLSAGALSSALAEAMGWAVHLGTESKAT